jgi:hypothetical protein
LIVEIKSQEKIQNKNEYPQRGKEKYFPPIADHIHAEIDIVVKDNGKIHRFEKNQENEPVGDIENYAQNQKPDIQTALKKIPTEKKLDSLYQVFLFRRLHCYISFEHYFSGVNRVLPPVFPESAVLFAPRLPLSWPHLCLFWKILWKRDYSGSLSFPNLSRLS